MCRARRRSRGRVDRPPSPAGSPPRLAGSPNRPQDVVRRKAASDVPHRTTETPRHRARSDSAARIPARTRPDRTPIRSAAERGSTSDQRRGGVIFSARGVRFSRRGATFLARGATFPARGAMFLARDGGFPRRGATFSARGATSSVCGVANAARAGIPLAVGARPPALAKPRHARGLRPPPGGSAAPENSVAISTPRAAASAGRSSTPPRHVLTLRELAGMLFGYFLLL